MGETVKFNKDALIEELKQIHKEMVSVYKELFTYKYENNEDFRNFIENEYRENGIGNDEKEKWNENFCHRTSYTLINKVLFIRICEDKRFMFNPEEDFIMGEPKDPNIGKKLSARGRDRWISLISNYTFGELLKFAFADMKESFKNIALFKEDKYEKLNPTKQELELKFMLDSKEYKKTPIYSYEENVAKIIEKLDTSKFDFNVPAEGNILGDVYEKFMDRETRKAIGQFYTPDFVIEYILNNTVAEADVVENPFVSVLDPACGSGHFLIMAYDILRKKFEENIDKLREKYADVEYVYKNEKMKGKEYWVKDRIHYHILKHCIFGADIDSFAVQLTTINLLLKDLEHITDELNIMECDSLIKWEEDYDWHDLKHQLEDHSRLYYTINYKDVVGIQRQDTLSWDKAEELVRLCEFWSKKYDYVVGNPPYVNSYNLTPQQREIYNNQNYSFLHMKFDLYVLFYERGISCLKHYGKLGYINPYSMNNQKYAEKLRKYLLDNTYIEKIVDYTGISVFDATVTGCIYILKLKKEHESSENEIEIIKVKDNERYFIKQILFYKTPSFMFRIELSSINVDIINKMNNNKKVDDFCYVSMGAEVHSKETDMIKSRKNERISKIKKSELYKPFLEGLDIEKYYIKEVKKFLNYQPKLMRRPKFPELFENNKIIIRNVTGENGIIATLDESSHYVDCTLNCCILGNNLKKVRNNVLNRKKFRDKKYEDIDLYALLAYLNANATNYYFKIFLGDNLHVNPNDIKELPIKLSSELSINYLANGAKRILQLKRKIVNNKNNFVKSINVSDDLLQKYVNIIELNTQMEREIELIQNNLNFLISKIYDFNVKEYKQIEDSFRISKYGLTEFEYLCELYARITLDEIIDKEVAHDFLDRDYFVNLLSERLSPEKFLDEHINNNKSIKQISEEYGYDSVTVSLLRKKYAKNFSGDEPWKFYSLSDLYMAINECLKTEVIKILTQKNKYINLDEIRNLLEEKLDNFKELMNIMRKDNPTKKSKDIVKEALNQFADTWNSYTKNINAGKESKELVKYYDNNYYGLSEWDDEIHKEYFIDAIKEYTEISPNEKKARDILKLFEGLNIKDKEDYIEIFINQIKKAFKK